MSRTVMTRILQDRRFIYTAWEATPELAAQKRALAKAANVKTFFCARILGIRTFLFAQKPSFVARNADAIKNPRDRVSRLSDPLFARGDLPMACNGTLQACEVPPRARITLIVRILRFRTVRYLVCDSFTRGLLLFGLSNPRAYR